MYKTSFFGRDDWLAGATVLATTDGGKTWIQELNAEVHTRYEDVFFVDRRRGWVLHRGRDFEAILRTTDGGKSWETDVSELDGHPLFGINSIYFLDETRRWAVGSYGLVLRYEP